MTICALQSTMSRELATRNLSPPGAGAVVRQWLTGKLLALADVYVPYRLYKVTIEDRGVQSTRYYAVDAATGTLDPYGFAGLPPSETFVEVETRNCHPVCLDEEKTRQLAAEGVRRTVFSRGFFRLSNPLINAELVRPEFYIPYWAGFYGDHQNLTVAVINAVRQTHEGSKVRQLVRRWLLDSPALLSSSID